MSMEAIAQLLPDYAKDLKLNLSSVLRPMELTPTQTWGTAVACAFAVRNPALLRAVMDEASRNVDGTTVAAAKSAGAVMAMNNVYYRFQTLSGHEKYSTLPARLRMNVLRTHGADPADFELWCLAVSALNGCSKCVVAHERVVKEKGLSEEQILASVRIASVLNGVAQVLDAEQMGVEALATV